MSESRKNWILYRYYSSDESELEDLINLFKKAAGGIRKPYGHRKGLLDLVPFLEIFIPFTAGVVLAPSLTKYFEGLFKPGKFKKIGERHRSEIANLCNGIESNIKRLLSPLASSPEEVLPVYDFKGAEKAAALRVSFGKVVCFIVLNHSTINEELIGKIPKAVTSTIQHIMKSGLPEGTHVLQLYYDKEQHDWKYIFIPSTDGFGNYIDRYVDLETGEIIKLKSAREFVKTFLPDRQDRYKFLVDPFRYL